MQIRSTDSSTIPDFDYNQDILKKYLNPSQRDVVAETMHLFSTQDWSNSLTKEEQEKRNVVIDNMMS